MYLTPAKPHAQRELPTSSECGYIIFMIKIVLQLKRSGLPPVRRSVTEFTEFTEFVVTPSQNSCNVPYQPSDWLLLENSPCSSLIMTHLFLDSSVATHILDGELWTRNPKKNGGVEQEAALVDPVDLFRLPHNWSKYHNDLKIFIECCLAHAKKRVYQRRSSSLTTINLCRCSSEVPLQRTRSTLQLQTSLVCRRESESSCWEKSSMDLRAQ